MFLFRLNYCSQINLFVNSLYQRPIGNMMLSTKKPILYGDDASPPVRFVMMTASLLNMDLEFHKVDLFKGENKTEFYKKINPLQKVPALSINNETLCDSHAIALYLCRKSGNNLLYPNEVDIMAKIDQMMYFNSGVLFPIDSDIFTQFFAGRWPVDEAKIQKWYSALDYLENKLNNQKFLTGNNVRLCDICCGSTVSSLEILVPLLKRHKGVKQWLKNLRSLSCFEINTHGLDRLRSFVKLVKT